MKKAFKSKNEDDSLDESTERNKAKRILDVVILDEGEEFPKDRERIRKMLPPMTLIDINREEEERDRIDIVLWL